MLPALLAWFACSVSPEPEAGEASPGEKLDATLQESTEAYWRGCDERFASFAAAREIELDAGRIGVHLTGRAPEDVAPLRARVELLGGAYLADVGPHLYAWLPIPKLRELAEDDRVVALEWNRPRVEPFSGASGTE